MADIGQIDIGEITRRYGEEEVARIMKEIVENNEKNIKDTKIIRGTPSRRKEKKTDRDKEKGREKDKRTGRDG